jgi:hypothetical protein
MIGGVAGFSSSFDKNGASSAGLLLLSKIGKLQKTNRLLSAWKLRSCESQKTFVSTPWFWVRIGFALVGGLPFACCSSSPVAFPQEVVDVPELLEFPCRLSSFPRRPESDSGIDAGSSYFVQHRKL